MTVLLVNPPWIVDGRKGVRAGSRWPHLKIEEEGGYMPFPFFLAYAAAVLKLNKLDVKLLDAIAENLTLKEFFDKVRKLAPDLIFLETSIPSLNYDLRVMKILKKISKAKIAISGLDLNITNSEFLKKHFFIDFVLFGECEQTLFHLVSCLKAGRDLEEVLGLIYREGSSIKVNKKRPLLENLDELSWPLRDDLPMERYLDAPGGMPVPSVQMWASRGCPYYCTFCAWPQLVYGKSSYRVRSITDVIDEMEYLVKEKGFKSVYFDDDTFNIGRERMMKFCEEIKKRNLTVPWAVMARADLMDKELLTNMKDAGLHAIKYGIESGCQELVDNANKNLDLKKAEEVINLTKQLGIKTHLTFTFGLPGETKETIKQTIDFALKLDPYSVQFSVVTPFPGTEYYNKLDEQGLIVSKKWDDYDGNSKSVIRTQALSPKNLEDAKNFAYRVWKEHKETKDKYSNFSPLKLFFMSLKYEGLLYTLRRTFEYIMERNFEFYKTKVVKEDKINREKGIDILVNSDNNMLVGDEPELISEELSFFNLDKFQKEIKNWKSHQTSFKGDMVSDILLVLCPQYSAEMSPLSLAYLSTYLKSRNFKPLVFDMNIFLFNNAKASKNESYWLWDNKSCWVTEELFKKVLNDLKEEIDFCVQRLSSIKTPVVGFSIIETNILFSVEIAKRLKQLNKDLIIIFGGPGCQSLELTTLIPEGVVDHFVIGEGEEALAELLGKIKNKEPVGRVLGVVPKLEYSKDGVLEYKPRQLIKQLDEIHFPTFNEFNLESYTLQEIPLLASRGCFNKCTFCNDHLSNSYRFRSAEHIFREINFHVKNHKIRAFRFNDLLVNGNLKVLEELADYLIKTKLDIRWTGQAMIRKDMGQRFFKKLKESGCNTLVYGIESFSDKVLKSMGKSFTVNDAKHVLKLTHYSGVYTMINIIVGFPEEGEKEFQETYDFIKKNYKYIDMVSRVSTCHVVRNSDLLRNYKKYGLIFSDDHHKTMNYEWYTKGGNTYEVRKVRLNKIVSLLSEKKIDLLTTNLYEEKHL